MGFGDDIMNTGEVLFLKKNKPNYKFVIGDGNRSFWSEIYDNNNDIIRAAYIKNFSKVLWIDNYDLNRPYRIYTENDENFYTWDYSYKAKKGIIYFTNEENNFSDQIKLEILKYSNGRKIIHIEPNVKKKRGWQNRDWGFDRWQEIVNKFKEEVLFIQTSFGSQNILKNVFNLHNINFRSACAVMKNSDYFLGTEGGMHHASAALNKLGIVIFGGFISPKITGYDFQINLYNSDYPQACGQKNICKHCEDSMKKISVETVSNEIKKLIAL